MQQIELKIKKKHKKETELILFEFPLEWGELTLRQFIDWYEITLKEDIIELQRTIELVSILSKKPLEEIEELPEKAFYQLVDVIAPLVANGFPHIDFGAETYEEKEFLEIEINGELYRWIPNYFKEGIGNISKMEQTLQGLNLISHFHYVLAFCLNKENEVFNSEKLDAKAQMFLDKLKMDEVYELLFFSSIRGESSFQFIKVFSKAPQAEQQLKEELQKLRSSLPDGHGMTIG